MMPPVAAVVLAAGLSQRMGVPKLVLPWGQRTVIGQVVAVLQEAGLGEIIVVTGGAESLVRKALQDQAVQFIHNAAYASGEMLTSVQTGIAAAMRKPTEAAMITLGDQPQIQGEVVRALLHCWQARPGGILIPSYKNRRGHPWLLRRSLWQEVLALKAGETLRDFLKVNAQEIDHLPVESDSILQDLDTPEAYERHKPSSRG
jgi:molybdenum cofactor cytidylyltransferase